MSATVSLSLCDVTHVQYIQSVCIMDVRWAHRHAVMEDTVARSNSSVIYENDCLCAFRDHQMSCNV